LLVLVVVAQAVKAEQRPGATVRPAVQAAVAPAVAMVVIRAELVLLIKDMRVVVHLPGRLTMGQVEAAAQVEQVVEVLIPQAEMGVPD
jgi:hypothetical protein